MDIEEAARIVADRIDGETIPAGLDEKIDAEIAEMIEAGSPVEPYDVSSTLLVLLDEETMEMVEVKPHGETKGPQPLIEHLFFYAQQSREHTKKAVEIAGIYNRRGDFVGMLIEAESHPLEDPSSIIREIETDADLLAFVEDGWGCWRGLVEKEDGVAWTEVGRRGTIGLEGE